MPTNDRSTGTRVHEVADGVYRIHTPVPWPEAGGFSFNQYLVVDDEPLLVHTGLRASAPAVAAAVARVVPLERLRWIAFSHVEADECGGMNALLAAAPNATAVCSRIAAMTSMEDLADRPPRALADGERLGLGARSVEWIDAPHVPHGWECGFLWEPRDKTLFCGDLLSQPGEGDAPLVESDVLGPSEAMRRILDYYAHGPNTGPVLERMAALGPRTLACMHGSAFRGDGGALLRDLAAALAAPAA